MTISRRDLLGALPAVALLPRALTAQTPRQLRARGLHSMTLAVSDVKRSLDFYQGLFGMPIQARHGDSPLLRVGPGPKFMALTTAAADGPTGVSRFGIGVEDFNVDRIVAVLGEHGVTRATSSNPAAAGPLKVLVATRDGTPEIVVSDPSGVVFQLQDPSYCGGSGPLGSTCGTVQPSTKKGLIAVQDYSHFTVAAASADESNTFYQSLFGFGIQAYQGPTAPVLGVGPGVHFLMFTGGGAARGRGGAPPRPPRVDHPCFGMENFDPDAVVKILEGYGIKPRGTNPSTPLVWYISQRMENRGGAPGTGTPEFYFTDPDNIAIQIQDVKYCGGGGVLGDVCPA
jgi:catechol 2,3-dioxygenase-like lactoylglutathione lyase family enzyme